MRLQWVLLLIVFSAACSQTREPARPDSHVILDQVFADWLTGSESTYARVYLRDEPLRTVWFDRENLPKGYTPYVKDISVSLIDGMAELQEGELYIHVEPVEIDRDRSAKILFFYTGAYFLNGATVTYIAKYTPSGWKVEVDSVADP